MPSGTERADFADRLSGLEASIVELMHLRDEHNESLSTSAQATASAALDAVVHQQEMAKQERHQLQAEMNEAHRAHASCTDDILDRVQALENALVALEQVCVRTSSELVVGALKQLYRTAFIHGQLRRARVQTILTR